MRYKFFHIPAMVSDAAEKTLNDFCAKHHVIDVERKLIDAELKSYWAICVTWSDNEGSLVQTTKRKSKIDYREVLNADDFTIYAKLRELRKIVAEREGTAVYNIFTNEQIANMVQQRVTSKATMANIKGIGQAKLDKYAQAFLECLQPYISKNNNETV